MKRRPCDCAGTAPGYPQHESGCASLRPIPEPRPDESRLSTDPVWAPADPNTTPRPAGEEEPF